MKNTRTRFIVIAALVAAFYALLTYLSLAFNLAYGPVQFRLSEALTLLPVVSGAAVPGLAVGCLLGNLTSPYGLVDIVCGTCASLLAAVGARPDAGQLSRPTAGFSRRRCKRRRKNV